ncbi:hypothetical protein ACV07N_05320 [Roseivirga echinicomitans]
MKKSMKFLLTALVIFTIGSCKPKSPYDTSTPEKMIYSLGQVSAQPKELNPIPYFYVEKDAVAITDFDESGFKALDAFESFKNAMYQHFPTKVTNMTKTKIEFNKDESVFSTVSLSLSASLIRPQLQDRTPEDYEYISVTDPTEDGVYKIKCRMVNTETELEVKKENNQYLMFLKDKDYIQIQKMAKFFVKADALFTRAAAELNDKKVTLDNFEEMSSSWDNEYMNLFQELN